MAPKLILDTNILVAGLRSTSGASFALLQATGTSLFTHGLTVALALEYEDVLKRPGIVPVTADDVDILLDHLCRTGHRVATRFRTRPAAADPDDDLVLEAAVAAHCPWVVTFNARDMAEGARQLNITLLTPGEVVQRLGIVR